MEHKGDFSRGGGEGRYVKEKKENWGVLRPIVLEGKAYIRRERRRMVIFRSADNHDNGL